MKITTSLILLIIFTFFIACENNETNNSVPNDEAKHLILIPRATELIAPAGIRTVFTVIKGDGTPVETLTEDNFKIINNKTGKEFKETGKSPALAPSTDVKFYTILTIDLSSSIFESGLERNIASAAKNFIKTTVENQNNDKKYKIAIYIFGSTSKSMLIQDFTSDHNLLYSKIDEAVISGSLGGRNLYGAYKTSLEYLHDLNTSDKIITSSMLLISNGNDEAGIVTEAEALTAKSNSNAEIYTIGIKGNYDENQIKNLASKNNNFFSTTKDNLDTTLKNISEKLLLLLNNNYVLGICTPVEGKSSYTIKAIKNNSKGELTINYDAGNIEGWSGDISNCSEKILVSPFMKKSKLYDFINNSDSSVDILFVVDNSGSMKEEQEKVAQNIVNFMKMLKKSADEGKTSYHIGVITTSMWDKAQTQSENVKNKEDGRLLLIKNSYAEIPDPDNPGRITLDCDTVSTTKRYLDNTDNDSVVDLLKYTIKCSGTDGSGIERGLDAMKKALSPGRLDAENRGFLRPEAKLMVIVIGDEDDCSTGIRAYDPVTGDPIETDPSFTNFPIAKQRGKDCIEQSDLIPPATKVITDRSAPEQNKLKPVSEYFDFLVNLKGGDYTKVGFATIVGPLNCWTGAINDMGQGPQSQSSSIPFAYQNCSYSSSILSQQMFDLNYNTCSDNVLPACSCTNDASEPTHCNTTSDLYTTCFNNAAGIPNRIPVISENSCSEAYLNGKCDDGKHCEVTEKGVKCVENTCSAENTNGTCPANQYCDNGVCTDKQPATYAEKDSYAAPGRRFLEMAKLVEAKNKKNNYAYSICLEDFGTPLSFIGSRLTLPNTCKYELKNRIEDPCSLTIEIFNPDDINLEHGIETTLNSPWNYKIDSEYEITNEELAEICQNNQNKPIDQQINIEKYLKKVNCDNNKKECFEIYFPTDECPASYSKMRFTYYIKR